MLSKENNSMDTPQTRMVVFKLRNIFQNEFYRRSLINNHLQYPNNEKSPFLYYFSKLEVITNVSTYNCISYVKETYIKIE